MENAKEKFVIEITDRGLVVTATASGAPTHLRFTAGEALMLLDILRNEEENLKEMAERDAPVGMRFQF